MAAGESGRLAEAVGAAEGGYARTTAAFDAAQMRFVIADAHVGILLLAGEIAEANTVARRLHERSTDLPGIARLMSAAIAGRVALAEGRVEAACALLEPAIAVLIASGDANGWAYRFQLPLTIAVALSGSSYEAAIALEELHRVHHPGYAYLHYEHALAQAWVSARQGVVSEGTRTCLAAAETCRINGQFAAEVLCLQTAAQLGASTVDDRLTELAAIVEGPRVQAANALATALRAGAGTDLSAASEELEAMGDRIAAADAAAYSAGAHRREGRRGSAYSANTRAANLLSECGRISTPATAVIGDEIPLSAREREIVALLAAGLSSRGIAERLSVSARTVEGHIYRAMARTGTRTREELAALLPRGHGDARP